MTCAPTIFHLAIPCRALDEAAAFCVRRLGCRLARYHDERITLELFGHQVVCHLDPEAVDAEPRMYPRDFGITFRDRDEFDAVLERARAGNAPFFSEPSVRFPGRREEHATFSLHDPSNNVIELKHYDDAAMMY